MAFTYYDLFSKSKRRAMDEATWLASGDPRTMLEFMLEGRVAQYGAWRPDTASDRKLRLFACAVEREWTAGSKVRFAFDKMDAVADGKLPVSAIDNIGFSYSIPRDAAAMAEECVRIHNSKGDPPRWAALLRDIFGNPYREPDLDGVNPHFWLEANVTQIAKAIYQDRDWAAMPILGDALEDAGCTDASILEHCRGRERCWCCRASFPAGSADLCSVCSPGQETLGRATGWAPLRGPHVRGCWVVDLILGKA